MRFLPIVVPLVLYGSGMPLQKAGDPMVAEFLGLLLGLVVLWADDVRYLFRWRRRIDCGPDR
jgi:hypothetical protein